MTTKASTTRTSTARRSTKTKSSKLQHLIPPQSVLDGYVHRTFDGYDDLDLFAYADGANFNTLLFGPTGPGKTRAIRSYAAKSKKPLVIIACNGGVDPATFWGQYQRHSDGSIKYDESEITTGFREGAIIYLDEVNFLHPRIGAVFHGALDDRRTIVIPELGNEAIPLHPDCWIVAAYNPGYQGTRPLNEAFKNRFPIKLEYNYDYDVERQVVPLFDSVSVDPLLELARKLRASVEDGTLMTPVSTNMLRDFVVIATDTSYNFAVMNFVNSFGEDERAAVKNAIDLVSDDLKAIVTLCKEENGNPDPEDV